MDELPDAARPQPRAALCNCVYTAARGRLSWFPEHGRTRLNPLLRDEKLRMRLLRRTPAFRADLYHAIRPVHSSRRASLALVAGQKHYVTRVRNEMLAAVD